ncbi:MAG TPA: integrin alpha [Actinomycetota bacterium]|nr:integrin alpha [Actinomycetota bacterium]
MAGAETHPAGAAYVVLGLEPSASLSLEELGDSAVRIDGPSTDAVVTTAAAAGDVNGDGLGDIVVGVNTADNNGRGDSGSAYVVFGRTSAGVVELSQFDKNLQGDDGYRIDGASSGDLTGESVSGIRDLTGDGLDEVLVGSPFGGATYVVPGKTSFEPVDLLLYDIGANEKGFVVRHPSAEFNDLHKVNRVGDVDGDGSEDLAIGLIRREAGYGRVYVVYGKESADPVDVRNLAPSQGFVITGERRGDEFGYSVAGAGDFDGDGYDDVIVGAPDRWERPGWGKGRAYVIDGGRRRGSLRASRLGRRGTFVDGPRARRDDFGRSVSAAGDVDSDGLADVLVGAPAHSPLGREYAGSTWLVFGRPEASSKGGRRGFSGARAADFAGWSLATLNPSTAHAQVVVAAAGTHERTSRVYLARLR